MNRPVDLYCFTGTGNTLLAARAMREVFLEAGLACRLIPLEHADPARIDPSHLIGVACPVAAMGTYPLVWRFLEALPQVDGTPFFLLVTMAGSGMLLGPVGALVESKGFETAGARQLVMPTNFFLREAAPKEEAKCAAARDDARAFARDLVADKAEWHTVPYIPDALCWTSRLLMKLWKWPLCRKLYPMAVDAEKCTACGLCERLCPTKAITRDTEGRPVIGTACEYCMRCVGFCPTGALRDSWRRGEPYRALPVGELETFLAGDGPS